MFVSKKKYTELVATAAVAREARHSLNVTEGELRAAQKEIRRLTNVIISLKERGYRLSPADTDERWGSYRMDEIDEPAAAPAVTSLDDIMPTAHVSELEAELARELQGAWDAD